MPKHVNKIYGHGNFIVGCSRPMSPLQKLEKCGYITKVLIVKASESCRSNEA